MLPRTADTAVAHCAWQRSGGTAPPFATCCGACPWRGRGFVWRGRFGPVGWHGQVLLPVLVRLWLWCLLDLAEALAQLELPQGAEQLTIDHGLVADQAVQTVRRRQNPLAALDGRQRRQLIQRVRQRVRPVGLRDGLDFKPIRPPQPPKRRRQTLDQHRFDRALRLIVVPQPVEQQAELLRVFLCAVRQHDAPGQQPVLDCVAARLCLPRC